MKLVSINIEQNKHFDTVLAFLKKEQPEVICLQEVLEEDFEYLEKNIGMPGVFKCSTFLDTTKEHYKENYGKKFGLAIFAHTIQKTGYDFYVGKEDYVEFSFETYMTSPDQHRNSLLLFADVLSKDGEVIRCITTHFPLTEKGESTPFQLSALERLFSALDTLEAFVLCGDFNAPRGGETFSRIKNRYRDTIPLHYTTSIDPVLHRERAKQLQLMVDGLFVTKEYDAHNVVLVEGVSDHLAVMGEIIKK